MTNEQQASADDNQVDNKLIHLEGDVARPNRAKDINNKINHLEDSLNNLQGELEVVNKSVEQGLDRLSDNDLDITAKVSETYKRLGEIDGTYKSLSKISDNINSEVKNLTAEMELVVEQSAAELGRVESSSAEQINETKEQHEQLVIRVNDLVEHSRETNSELTQSIRKNTDALLALEKQLASEIEVLANTTEARDNEIATEVDETKRAVEKNRARIIQMQTVDEALAKRATALEIEAAELTDKSRKLESSVDLLDARTSDISDAVIKLQEKSQQQASLISDIQKSANEMANSLLALTRLETFHFRSVTGALLLVLLAVIALYFYQYSSNQENIVASAERNLLVDQKVTNLQQQNTAAENDLVAINDKLIAMNEKLESDIKETNGKLLDLNDQADSLDGRLNTVSPFSQFGKDNTIHGPQWLAAQPSNKLVIQLLMVSDKKELYDMAQRYSYYLKQQLAYYTVKTAQGEKYVLTYGSFATDAELSAALYNLPRYLNHQRPDAVRMADIQRTIAL